MSNPKEKGKAFSPGNNKASQEMDRHELQDEALAAAAGGNGSGSLLCELLHSDIESPAGWLNGCSDFQGKNAADKSSCSNCIHAVYIPENII